MLLRVPVVLMQSFAQGSEDTMKQHQSKIKQTKHYDNHK